MSVNLVRWTSRTLSPLVVENWEVGPFFWVRVVSDEEWDVSPEFSPVVVVRRAPSRKKRTSTVVVLVHPRDRRGFLLRLVLL